MKKALGFIIIAIISASLYFTNNNNHDHSHDEETTHEGQDPANDKTSQSTLKTKSASKLKVSKVHGHNHAIKKPKQDKPVKVPDFEPQNNEEVSIQTMTDLMSDTISNQKDSKALRESLIVLGLKPVTSVDSNPYTGTMKIVRTEKNLPGTRYFHTQIFSDGDGKEVIQYSAIDVRGGPEAFNRTSLASAKSFNLNANPDYQKPGFNKWSLGDGRNLWVKKMEAKDLKDDPFNAYSEEDVGTIRVVVELEIHHEGEGEKHLAPVPEESN